MQTARYFRVLLLNVAGKHLCGVVMPPSAPSHQLQRPATADARHLLPADALFAKAGAAVCLDPAAPPPVRLVCLGQEPPAAADVQKRGRPDGPVAAAPLPQAPLLPTYARHLAARQAVVALRLGVALPPPAGGAPLAAVYGLRLRLAAVGLAAPVPDVLVPRLLHRGDAGSVLGQARCATGSFGSADRPAVYKLALLTGRPPLCPSFHLYIAVVVG